MGDVPTPQSVELHDIHNRPELMTSLLYKKLIQKLDTAITLLPQQRYLEANHAMQYCNEILTRLGFGIKYEAGVMADQLELLYKYMFDQIYEANLKKDIDKLKEIRRLVRLLDDAWTTAMERATQAKQEVPSETMRNEAAAAYETPVPVRKPAMRINPYQQREIEHETYQYEQQKQEVHLKK